jgi:cytochrome P450
MAEPLKPDVLYSPEFGANPEPVWRRLRHDHPCFYDAVRGMYVLTRYADVAAAFADHDTFSAAPYEQLTGSVVGPTLISRDDHGHVLRRSIVAPEFAGKRLAHYQAAIEACANDLIDRFVGRRRVDLIRQFTRRLPVDVIAVILGMTGDGDRFRDWVTTMIRGLDPVLHHEGRRAHAEFCAHIAPLLEGVDDPARTDLIARIARAEVEGERLSHEELLAFCGLLFIAGGETTDKAMGNMWWNLLHHRDQLDAVLANPQLWDAAFSETMRRTAPVVNEDRRTTREVVLHGVTIPAGSLVCACIGAANLDETVFADSERFDIFRADLHLGKELRNGGSTEPGRSGHLGFGLGKHFCIGYELARTESIVGSRLVVERCGVPELAPEAATAGLRVVRSMRSVVPDVPVLFPPR